MPLDAMWDELVEKQLEWDPSELVLYLDPSFGTDERLLCAQSKAPTVLHSWGHVNRPCPCGCRAAFNLARLRSGGARGFGLLSARSSRYRHLHSEEGAMLCTVPPSFHFPMPPRAALSLLGQIAAPLQVLWVTTGDGRTWNLSRLSKSCRMHCAPTHSPDGSLPRCINHETFNCSWSRRRSLM